MFKSWFKHIEDLQLNFLIFSRSCEQWNESEWMILSKIKFFGLKCFSTKMSLVLIFILKQFLALAKYDNDISTYFKKCYKNELEFLCNYFNIRRWEEEKHFQHVIAFLFSKEQKMVLRNTNIYMQEYWDGAVTDQTSYKWLWRL